MKLAGVLLLTVSLVSLPHFASRPNGRLPNPDPQTRAEMEKYVGCPLEGSYRNGQTANGKYAALNLYKNRSAIPEAFDKSITLEQLSAPGNDENRWQQDKQIAVRVTGYVAFVIQNFEGESCNCFKLDDAHSDTHMDLVVDPSRATDFSTHVITEVTPRMKFLARKAGMNWSSLSLSKQFLGKKVTVEGWLMWDGEHARQARNTHPVDPQNKNWRATCWEVHPVTAIYLATP